MNFFSRRFLLTLALCFLLARGAPAAEGWNHHIHDRLNSPERQAAIEEAARQYELLKQRGLEESMEAVDPSGPAFPPIVSDPAGNEDFSDPVVEKYRRMAEEKPVQPPAPSAPGPAPALTADPTPGEAPELKTPTAPTPATKTAVAKPREAADGEAAAFTGPVLPAAVDGEAVAFTGPAVPVAVDGEAVAFIGPTLPAAVDGEAVAFTGPTLPAAVDGEAVAFIGPTLPAAVDGEAVAFTGPAVPVAVDGEAVAFIGPTLPAAVDGEAVAFTGPAVPESVDADFVAFAEIVFPSDVAFSAAAITPFVLPGFPRTAEALPVSGMAAAPVFSGVLISAGSIVYEEGASFLYRPSPIAAARKEAESPAKPSAPVVSAAAITPFSLVFAERAAVTSPALPAAAERRDASSLSVSVAGRRYDTGGWSLHFPANAASAETARPISSRRISPFILASLQGRPHTIGAFHAGAEAQVAAPVRAGSSGRVTCQGIVFFQKGLLFDAVFQKGGEAGM